MTISTLADGAFFSRRRFDCQRKNRGAIFLATISGEVLIKVSCAFFGQFVNPSAVVEKTKGKLPSVLVNWRAKERR